MKTWMSTNGKKGMVFLTRTDMDILIYMTSDVWITPEIKRFKKEILRKGGISDPDNKNHNNS